MYYLHTTNKRSYTVGDMTIPALAPAGKKQEWLQLDEAGLQSLKSIKIMDGLIKRSPVDDPVYAFIDKKRAQGKPYYVYMTAGANKFLRIYYGRVKEYLASLPQSE